MKRDEGAMGHTTAIRGNNQRSLIAREAKQDIPDKYQQIYPQTKNVSPIGGSFS